MKENKTTRLIPIAFFILFFIAMALSIYQQFAKPKIQEPIKVAEPVQVIIATSSATLTPGSTQSPIIRYIPASTLAPQKESYTETTTVTTNTTTNTVTNDKTNPVVTPTSTSTPMPTSIPTNTPTPTKSILCRLGICL